MFRGFGKKKDRKGLVDEQVRLGFVLEPEDEEMDVSGFILGSEDEEIVPGPVPMPEPDLAGMDEIRRICTELSYSIEVGVDDGYVINDGNYTFFYPYGSEGIERALDWLRADLAASRYGREPAAPGMTYRAFAGMAFEAVGSAIHRSGGNPFTASWPHAKWVLQRLPVSAICSARELDEVKAGAYLVRLMHEGEARWEVFQADARNGEI